MHFLFIGYATMADVRAIKSAPSFENTQNQLKKNQKYCFGLWNEPSPSLILSFYNYYKSRGEL